MRTKIWKLQRPLATNMPVMEVMAYPKDRKLTAFIAMTDREIETLFGDELKIYAKAKVNKTTGILEVKKIVEEQDW